MRAHRSALLVALVIGAAAPATLRAQVRVDNGRHTRLQRFARDMAYGVVEGIGFAAVDQARGVPHQWPKNDTGFYDRASSQIGEFIVQETVTEALAAAMNRPLDYVRCGCSSTSQRIGTALERAVADQLPDGHHAFALPRFAGAYAGALAQSYWRPGTPPNRARFVFINGTTSLAIGAGINLFHEFIR